MRVGRRGEKKDEKGEEEKEEKEKERRRNLPISRKGAGHTILARVPSRSGFTSAKNRCR
jgi:hypothetical protein